MLAVDNAGLAMKNDYPANKFSDRHYHRTLISSNVEISSMLRCAHIGRAGRRLRLLHFVGDIAPFCRRERPAPKCQRLPLDFTLGKM